MRKATWLILIWTGLMASWAIDGASRVACAANNCQAGTVIGDGNSWPFIFAVWFVGFIVLSIAWRMTRPTTNVK